MATTLLDLPQSVYEDHQNQPFNFHESKSSQLPNRRLPQGFPEVLSTPLAWTGSQFVEEDYIYHLTSSDKIEIDTALAHFKELGLDGDLVNPTNFPLSTLSATLRQLSLELHRGKGFFVIRGIEYAKYSVEDSTVIFLALQSFIAEKRGRQDEAGNMIIHIIADPFVSSKPRRITHPRHSKEQLSFHTDQVGDILGFQTRQSASKGGDCIISPFHTIYNELATTRPDIIHALAAANWPFVSPHPHQRPILFSNNNELIINFAIQALSGSPLFPHPKDFPMCTARQLEALDCVQKIAETHSLSFATQVGDLHFVNNLAVLHRRDKWVDDPGKKRHLARLWCRNDELGWGVPEWLKGEWKCVFEGDGDRVWNVEPMPEAFFPLRKYGL